MSVLTRFKQLFSKPLPKVTKNNIKSELQDIKVTKPINPTNTIVNNNNNKEMIPTTARLAHAYKPLIKFVGNKESLIQIMKSHNYEEVKPHPCTMNNILPGSKDCLSVTDILSKQLPFKVVPYVNKNVASQSASKVKYDFVPRGLKPGELESVFQLPKRYQYKPIDELEIDTINGGGAL